MLISYAVLSLFSVLTKIEFFSCQEIGFGLLSLILKSLISFMDGLLEDEHLQFKMTFSLL